MKKIFILTTLLFMFTLSFAQTKNKLNLKINASSTNTPISYNTVPVKKLYDPNIEIKFNLDSLLQNNLSGIEQIIRRDSFVYILTYADASIGAPEYKEDFEKFDIFAKLSIQKIKVSDFNKVMKKMISDLDREVEQDIIQTQKKIKRKESINNKIKE